MLATSQDAVQLQAGGFTMHWITWQARGLADIDRHDSMQLSSE